MSDIVPSQLPEDQAAEMLAVIREATRLAREGGSVEERAALDARKATLLDRIALDEAQHVERSAEAARAAYCREHTHCADWPLCGHTDPAATRQ